jgi:hypothetical protein
MFDRLPRIALIALLAAVPLAAQAPEARHAQRGDAVTGVPLSDDGKVLQLDTTPCAATRSIVVFHRPYTREAAGTIHCGNAPKGVIQAIQQ